MNEDLAKKKANQGHEDDARRTARTDPHGLPPSSARKKRQLNRAGRRFADKQAFKDQEERAEPLAARMRALLGLDEGRSLQVLRIKAALDRLRNATRAFEDGLADGAVDQHLLRAMDDAMDDLMQQAGGKP